MLTWLKSWVRIHLSTILFFSVLVFVRATFANQYVVPSGSMEPTIAIGDRIFVNRIAYDLKVPLSHIVLRRLAEPQRGDIVVFDSVREPSVVMVKRLIGLPGDEILVRDGQIMINGKEIPCIEKEVGGSEGNFHCRENLDGRTVTVQRIPELRRFQEQRLIVPEGHYFMMGDNRDNSSDSRFWGFVPRDHLIGRATRVLYSLDFHHGLAAIQWNRFGHAL